MKRLVLLTLWFSTLATTAFADGSAQLGATQALRAGTEVYVEILDAGETILWTGVGSVAVEGPGGEVMGSFASGATIPTTYGNGAYKLTIGTGQTPGVAWDIGVQNQSDSKGRVYAFDWHFNAGSFAVSAATNASFYAVVPGGSGSETSVIELQLNGLAGYVYTINANRFGVDGSNGGRSVVEAENNAGSEFPIYLRPPSTSSYSRSTPTVSDFLFDGGTDTDVNGNAIDPCSEIAAGESTGYFRFTSDVNGSFHIVCDVDQDGLFEKTTGDDVLITGSAQPGENSVGWIGRHNGQDISPGDYDCIVEVNVGEFHYVGQDIETSYPGMRLYEVQANDSRIPLNMYWSDTLVQYKAVTMQNGQQGLETSGESGIASGDYNGTVTANVNARSWGEFAGSGKGNQSYLDTWTRLSSATSTTIQVGAADTTIDSDGDGLSDFEESCLLGSDPNLADTDGDGTNDGEQYGELPSPAEHGGIESNGKRANALARRAVQRSRMSVWSGALETRSELEPLLPDASLLPGARRSVANVYDLIDLTNADAIVGADWLNEKDERLGTVLMVSTQGEHYEHSKPLCDRVRGSVVDDLQATDVSGSQFLSSTIHRPSESYRDHSMLSKAFVRDGRIRFEAGWIQEQFSKPESDEWVVEIQVWGRTRLVAERLSKGVVERLEAQFRNVNEDFMADDEERAELAVEQRRRTFIPQAWFRSGTLWGRTLVVDFGVKEPAKLEVRYSGWSHNDERISAETLTFENTGSETEQELTVPLAKELTVELLADGVLLDRLWLSDGVWTRFDDNLWGGNSKVETFSATACGDNATGEFALGGCASSKGSVAEFIGVARHFTRPIDLMAYDGVRFSVDANQSVLVCVQSLEPIARACTSRKSGDVEMAFSELGVWEGDRVTALKNASLITFSIENEGEGAVRVSALELVKEMSVSEQPRTAGGCSTAAGGPWQFALLILVCLGFRKRETSVPR